MKNQRRFAPTKTGRLAPEWVAAFLRNQWPESAEYAVPWKETGYVLRYHIGLEDIGDLLTDLRDGFDRLNYDYLTKRA